jgi:hypothetical protein
MCPNGFCWHFNRSVLTVFSACNYCENANKAAAAVYSPEAGISFTVFEPPREVKPRLVPHRIARKETGEEDSYDSYDDSDEELPIVV